MERCHFGTYLWNDPRICVYMCAHMGPVNPWLDAEKWQTHDSKPTSWVCNEKCTGMSWVSWSCVSAHVCVCVYCVVLSLIGLLSGIIGVFGMLHLLCQMTVMLLWRAFESCKIPDHPKLFVWKLYGINPCQLPSAATRLDPRKHTGILAQAMLCSEIAPTCRAECRSAWPSRFQTAQIHC